jgi:hypothetical protein
MSHTSLLLPAIGRRRLVLLAVGSGCAAVPLTAAAQSGQASGTVQITQLQVAFIVSGNVGSGRLQFQGRTWPFSVGGLGAGGYGVSRIEASGTVHGLSRIEQFPGVYFSVRYGAAVGTLSTGELLLQNRHGVSMRLKAIREGLALSLGADGIQISLR